MKKVIQYSAKMGLLAFSTGMSIFLFELLAWALDVSQLPANYKSVPMYEYHDRLGWNAIPNASVNVVSEQDGVDSMVNFDALGVRKNGNDSVEAENAFRLLVVGDSVTAGIAVNDSETFCARLEQLFQQSNKNVRVFNAGIPGYGTDQSFIKMQDLLPKIQPHAVLYVFCGNDLNDNLTIKHFSRKFSKPAFVFKGEELEPVNLPPRRDQINTFAHIEPTEDGYSLRNGSHSFVHLRYWLHKHSVIYRLAKKWKQGSAAGDAATVDLENITTASLEQTSKSEYQLKLLRKMVTEMSHLTEHFYVSAYIKATDPHPTDPAMLLERICEEEDLPFFDLGQFIGDWDEEVRFAYDPHLNTEGHRRAARALHHFLLKEGIPESLKSTN